MKNVTERIAALSPDKQMRLLQRLKHKDSQPVSDPPLTHSPSDDWIVRYRQNEQARLRLFCFPYAGGGASIFRPWLDGLPSEVELCGIQLPGRENRLAEPAYTRLAPLVQRLADALYPYLDRPFAFYGHSMGALVSFELARQLRRTHDKHPVCLYLAAYRAPQLPNPNIKIYHLPSEVFKVVLRAEGIPDMILQNEELMQAMLPTLRADFELCDTYEYREEPPLACPFTIFGGLEDVRVHAADLEAWSLHSSTTCSQFLFSGSHFFLHAAQHLLLAAISRGLEVQLNAPALSV
ncbi:MAG: thioesterase [Ktedonobacteraceae bacterium]|nr:thioesterase [Ktedonobacteraceae bacterium]